MPALAEYLAFLAVIPMPLSVPHAPALLGFAALRFDPGWRMPRHTHTGHHEMIFLLAGRVAADTQGRSVGGGAGEALVYPQGVDHAEREDGGDPVRMFCLAWEGPADPAWPLICLDRRGRMAVLLDWMQALYPARSEADGGTLDALLAVLLAEYREGGAGGDDERLARARRFAQERLAEPLCLDDLARAACLSRYHFASLFRAQVGVAPMEWVRRARVEAARVLLLTSDLPLAAIAPRVGLRDEFHLSRVFRRVTGRPPGALRRERPVETRPVEEPPG